MYARIIDVTNPRYRGRLPKPRGPLPVPPEDRSRRLARAPGRPSPQKVLR